MKKKLLRREWIINFLVIGAILTVVIASWLIKIGL